MLFNVIIGFVIPWIAAIPLCLKARSIVLTVAPFTAMIAMTLNVFGISAGFWKLAPVFPVETLSTLPVDLGFYPVLGSYFVYALRLQKAPDTVVVFGFTAFTFGMEILALYAGKVTYGNGWGPIHTFFSYLLPYSLVYTYHRVLHRLRIL